ncbi:hypothetical protein GH714_004071 [Hevea brasiliensis]|uniref:Uncharacterized protein n=1 Tax=Hevea brasiliensis TaxID=3981 RepID=A0A6A6KNB1_HEVBR|nr:hypothetical protein GH714_004071 [Hevea brasiliensis]
MASGSSYDIPLLNTDKTINKKIFMASLAASNMGSEVAGGDDSAIFPTGIMPPSDQVMNSRDAGLEVAQNHQKEPTGSFTNVGDGNHAFGMEIVLASEIHGVKECEAHDTKMQNAGKGHAESTSVYRKRMQKYNFHEPSWNFSFGKIGVNR